MVVLTVDQVAPDGLRMVVDWDQLRVGSSLFIPCINTTKAKKDVLVIFERKGWRMRYAIRVENGFWGVRFWRLA